MDGIYLRKILFNLPEKEVNTREYSNRIIEMFGGDGKTFHKTLDNCQHLIKSETGFIFLNSIFFNGSNFLSTDYVAGRFAHYHVVECNIISNNEESVKNLEKGLKGIFINEIEEYPK